MAQTDLKRLLQLAQAAALLAGRQLKAHQAEWGATVLEDGRDVKVHADRLAENIILQQLQAASDLPILTEETGWHAGRGEELAWVVDPLDGSFNYQQQIPSCCVAIALVKQQEPVLGVIYDFNRDELFSGLVGVGAWRNEQSMQVSQTTQSSKGVLNTGFPARQDYSDAGMQNFFNLARNFRKVRMLGSAALALAYVAAGRADGYHEVGAMFWDVAAGCALIKAAGGVYTIQGDVFTAPLKVTAHNGKIGDGFIA